MRHELLKERRVHSLSKEVPDVTQKDQEQVTRDPPFRPDRSDRCEYIYKNKKKEKKKEKEKGTNLT